MNPFEQLRNGVRAHLLKCLSVGCPSLGLGLLAVVEIFDEPFAKSPSLVRWLRLPDAENDKCERYREASERNEELSVSGHLSILAAFSAGFNLGLPMPGVPPSK